MRQITVVLATLISLGSTSDARLWPELRARAGARYDDVRMCVASGAGTKGGPAMELAASWEIPLTSDLELALNLPLMRPILFGVAFEMVQFEPDVELRWIRGNWRFGPTLGLSLHYGPDYTSESSGTGRTPSFWAIGPRIGLYAGRTLPWFETSTELGLHPYVAPLFGLGDAPAVKRGVVFGGTLDLTIRFGVRRGAQKE